MRIDSSYLGMESERTYSSTEISVRKYSTSVRDGALDSGSFDGLLNTDTNSKEDDEKNKDIKEPNASIGEQMDALKAKISNVKTQNLCRENDMRETIKRIRQECLNLILRLLFPNIASNGNGTDENSNTLNLKDEIVANNISSPSNGILRMSFNSVHYFEEHETTSFDAKGIVNCADGRQIDFGINLNMSRSFSEYYSEEISSMEVSLTDPLIINFDGNVTEVSDQKFYFDIDMDGVEDEISKLIGNSGFLALDLNEDGIINDGSELFGTKSGDGFKDLKVYDTDNDGWIDEDDEIFEKLKIWTIDEEGNSHLYSLKDKNIGAIGLSHANTQFGLNSLVDNTTNAVIRSTGVFLYEDGNVGSVQQVDFSKNMKQLQAYA